MISSKGSLEDFFKKINGKQYFEAIKIADEEATEAERRLLSDHRHASLEMDSQINYDDYSKSLKQFIHYLRYWVKPKITNEKTRKLFNSYMQSVPYKIGP
jgi:DNA replicative helicase MCM subunit Mcm2 (Cdc46/Mcm family)